MGLRDYFAHKTAAQRLADKEAEERDEKMREIKKRLDEEQKIKDSQNRQPSQFQEDLSKVSKKIVTGVNKSIAGAKKGIHIAAPVVKQVAIGTAKSVKHAVEQAAPVVERMGKGAAEAEFYEPERKRKAQQAKQPTTKPMKMHNFKDDTAPAPRIGKEYEADQFINEKRPKPRTGDDEFGVSSFSMSRQKKEKETPRKTMKQPEGAEKYFVNVHKKRLPPKEEKKGKGGRGFGLGF